jgi:AraC family transcriptional regulator
MSANVACVDGPDRLGVILDSVEQSLDEPTLNGQQLADRAYLCRFHFDRLVASAVGEPPGTFRRRLLLERAAHRLATTTDPVTDVALDAGYGSPDGFARAFRRAYGCPPSGSGGFDPTRRCRPKAACTSTLPPA